MAMSEQEKKSHTFSTFILAIPPKSNRRQSSKKKRCKNSRIFWRATMNKSAVYERIKAEIARTAKSAEEYERRIKALAKKLRI
jgi:hypothetical protein